MPPPNPQNPLVNFSLAPGQWNRMVVEFFPATVVNNAITQAAKLKVYFSTFDANGNETRWVTFGGINGWEMTGDSSSGTGSRGNVDKFKPLAVGSLFLQSHWGSLVEYKNAVIVQLIPQSP